MNNELHINKDTAGKISSDKPVHIKGIDHVIYLDENIADIIVVLNEKGYRTACCCEGHWYDLGDYFSSTWIAFAKDCTPPRPIIDGFERHCRQWGCQKYPSFCYGGLYNHAHPCEVGSMYGGEIRFFYTQYKRGISYEDKLAEKNRVLAALLDWANNLPPYDKEMCSRREYWCRLPKGHIDFESGDWDHYYDICEDPTMDLDKEFAEHWQDKCRL